MGGLSPEIITSPTNEASTMAAYPIVVNATDYNAGVLPGARLSVFRAGTTTLTSVYKTADLDTLHTNPVICDSAGRAVAWLDTDGGNVKVVLQDAAGAQTYFSQDNIDFSPARPPYIFIYPWQNDPDQALAALGFTAVGRNLIAQPNPAEPGYQFLNPDGTVGVQPIAGFGTGDVVAGANNAFTGANTFSSPGNVFAGDGSLLTALSRLALDIAPNPQNVLGSVGLNEVQGAAGLGPRRILINTNGTHIINAQNYAPALHFVLLPAAGSATLDCSALVQDARYDFVSGTGGTTCTLDFGEMIFVRSPHVGAGVATVRTIDLPPNQRVTVIRLSGNQVFVDFGSPRYAEGFWLPTVYGSSDAGTQGYALRNGRWMLNGGWLSFTGYVVLNATSGATGNVRIGIDALPFPPANAANEFYAVSIPYWLGLTSPVSGGATFGAADHIEVYRAAGGSSTTLPASELTSTTRFRFSGGYPI